MKVRILSVETIDNASVNVTFRIIKNDGSSAGEFQRGFVSTASTQAQARSELIQSFKNIRDSVLEQQASKCSVAAQAMLGTDVDIA